MIPKQMFASSSNSSTYKGMENVNMKKMHRINHKLNEYHKPSKTKITCKRMRKNSNRRRCNESIMSPWEETSKEKVLSTGNVSVKL